jgi:hypothetical protein
MAKHFFDPGPMKYAENDFGRYRKSKLAPKKSNLPGEVDSTAASAMIVRTTEVNVKKLFARCSSLAF